jgi:predicted Zn-dependent protease
VIFMSVEIDMDAGKSHGATASESPSLVLALPRARRRRYAVGMRSKHQSRCAAALVALLSAACEPSVEAERALGEQSARQIESQSKMVREPTVARYVDSLGRAIARVADSARVEWSFGVVQQDDANAFALPGGFVFVHSGLITRTRGMEELAGVLGHEIGHVLLRHSAKQMGQRTKANFAVSLFCNLTGWCSSVPAQIAINVGGAALFARYSREDEAEADSAAVDYLRRAGIDPRGVPEMFERLLAERSRAPAVVGAFFASHPLEEARIAHTREQALRVPEAELEALRRADAGYQAMMRALSAPPFSD